jgi:hypothetical protein
MPEQTFKSPNFYERELDLTSTNSLSPSGTPAGIIGTSKRGPAFVPTTVGNFGQFSSKFGGLDTKSPGTYAVNEFLKHRTALTFLRVLGAGSNSSDTDIARTKADGRVRNAGFRLYGDDSSGRVFFLYANHTTPLGPAEPDRSSSGKPEGQVVRAMIMTPVGKIIEVNESINTQLDLKEDSDIIKSFTVSLDPSSENYIAKVLNGDPEKFVEEGHLLYADFPIDSEVSFASQLEITSGKTDSPNETSFALNDSGDETSFLLSGPQAFGSFDVRYRSASTPWFTSQPFGDNSFDLFRFESLDDGEVGNAQWKISIADLRASVDDADPYPTFTVQVRDWSDTDANTKFLESFSGCTLNPSSPNYIGRLIGDLKSAFDFDATDEAERRVVTSGKYSNRSNYIRVIVHSDLEAGLVPASAMPFGFRGVQVLDGLKINNDTSLPPLPLRFKITKSPTAHAPAWDGAAVLNESTLSSLYWGVKFERDSNITNPNIGSEKNGLLQSYSKFLGNPLLGLMSVTDDFTLARVALSVENTPDEKLTSKTATQYMREAAYLRDNDLVIDPVNFTISGQIADGPDDGTALDTVNRITLATILSKFGPVTFNKFSQFAKFTTFAGGGWDGLNILNKNERRMGDRATSIEGGGCAHVDYVTPGFGYSLPGSELDNFAVSAYKTAARIMTEPAISSVNLLALPGIRESLVTDYVADLVADYGLALYLMDIPSYKDGNTARLFDDESGLKPNIANTVEEFEARKIDNNYVAVYYPDVVLDDAVNRRRVRVPASVAALGALAFNDRVAYPWFAPAGFNRAALDFVTNVPVRLNVSERDSLYEARINPIATFPRLGFVIYGQKTLQVKKSSLDRVNVRRLLLEVKRIVKGIAQNLVFEQNTPDVRNRFVADTSIRLALIQAAAGVESFQVVMNETNNSRADIDANRINGRIVVVPTRVIEFIAIDFIVTNGGVEFV